MAAKNSDVFIGASQMHNDALAGQDNVRTPLLWFEDSRSEVKDSTLRAVESAVAEIVGGELRVSGSAIESPELTRSTISLAVGALSVGGHRVSFEYDSTTTFGEDGKSISALRGSPHALPLTSPAALAYFLDGEYFPYDFYVE